MFGDRLARPELSLGKVVLKVMSEDDEAIQVACNYLTAEAIARVEHALNFAKVAHHGQWRVSGESFICHPVAVTNNLAQLHSDECILTAALLHDVVEDTEVTLSQIEQEFGVEVARLVDGVTKDVVSSDETDKGERQHREKLMQAILEDARVGLIRLADRLDNMRTLYALSRSRQLRMARETLILYVPLAYYMGLTNWAAELLYLALRYLIVPKSFVSIF